MRKPTSWPYEKFTAYLFELMSAAGIPDSSRGTPNTVIFGDLTGVDPSRVSQWKQGKNRPTSDSLRQIAGGLAPRMGVDPRELLTRLEVAAGLRSAAEAGAAADETSQPVDPRSLVVIRQRYHTAGDEDREWLLRKLDDLVEQIEMRDAARTRKPATSV